MPDEVREHSLRILKAVHEHVKGRAGETIPLSEVVRQAGLQHYGPAYNAAVEDLIDEGELEEDDRWRSVSSGDHPSGTLYYKITQRGIDKLREGGVVE
jgi:hypothetical protein